MNQTIQQLQREVRDRDQTIQNKDGEIERRDRTIAQLEAEIAALKNGLDSGGAAAAELKRLLAETEERLREALAKIDDLDKTVIANQAKFEAE